MPALALIDERTERFAELSTRRCAYERDMGDSARFCAMRALGTRKPLSLGSRYVHRGTLGFGAMGEVHAFSDRTTERELAVKVPHVEIADARRFVREARVQARLAHRTIARVHGTGVTDDGRPYFAMDRIDGVTLRDVLRDDEIARTFSRRTLLSAFITACEGVDHAHRCGVVHRDLKPSNVMLGHNRRVFVIDWGVAAVSSGGPLDAISQTSLFGTPAYAAPETLDGGNPDERADVYSLGVVLFELITRTPFARMDVRRNERLSAPLASVIARAVATRPGDRLPSVGHLLRALSGL